MYKYVTDCFMVLDLETSVEMDADNKPFVTWLSYGYCILYDIHNRKINKCFFRDWDTLKEFFDYINYVFKDKQIICYVHNLSFDGDFLIKNVSRPNKLLSNGSHKLISLELEDYPTILFKCSYMLTNKKLRELGEIVNLPKLDDDYKTLYPDEEVKESSKIYCERDCDIVAKYIIEQFLPKYKYIQHIPYTKTGIVRKRFKELAKSDTSGWDAYPDEDCYDLMNRAYRGAITISNPKYTGIMLENVMSFDETSEYPSIMLTHKFPYAMHKVNPDKYEFRGNKLYNKETNKEVVFYIGSFTYYNIRRKYDWCWLSAYKTESVDPFSAEWYNGKLREAAFYKTSLTNIDIECVDLTYVYSRIEINELLTAEECKVDYLPQCYFDLLIEFGTIKTTLKNKLKQLKADGKGKSFEYEKTEIDYGKAKNDFNAIYGMCVQKLIPQEYEIDMYFYWKPKDIAYKKGHTRLFRNFYFGVYITAYARKELLQHIVHNCPDTFVYADTDSIKMLKGEFKDLKDGILPEFRDMPCFANFGHFDYEGTYEKFVTWGAKKYAYQKDGEVYGVVAGLPKFRKFTEEEQIRMIQSFDDFYLGKVYEKCKLAHCYIYTGSIVETVDDEIVNIRDYNSEEERFMSENNIHSNGGCALFAVDYKLNITDNDKWILDKYGNWEKRAGKELENELLHNKTR